jgi:hypothetical protein
MDSTCRSGRPNEGEDAQRNASSSAAIRSLLSVTASWDHPARRRADESAHRSYDCDCSFRLQVIGDGLQREVNRSRACNRAPGERVVATLKTWKILTRLRRCSQRASTIIAAIRAIQTIEDQHERS